MSSSEQQQPRPSFKPALIIVDVQEDFCPPNGALAVPQARAIIPPINTLLTLPFALKLATQDYHPATHISFASNHPNPDNVPFDSYHTIANPSNPAETQTTRLWPVHCVQDTSGAELVKEITWDRVDHVVQKGQDPTVESYSGFGPPFRNPRYGETQLLGLLRGKGITHVYVCGLAMDYCVKSTAVDAAEEGFVTFVVEEATRGVDRTECVRTEGELDERGVRCISMEGEELKAVQQSGGA
ncbi:Isochorismatase hydrolase [Saccharata proteae CBS 121410]|uniref:nicotinamidase n=1 Tax=Saccharata proteae CBS 121410 TaxID=1314787 RepID=A0A9P4LXC8_9PEZI|nr:Isochorismatase hydrolase [Saccharata proteae CBS 121410]